MDNRTCEVIVNGEHCQKPREKRGWCNMHYKRWKRLGDVGEVESRRIIVGVKVCTVQGCEEPYYRRVWCNRHYLRWRRTGDPLGSMRIPAVERFWANVDKDGPVNPVLGTRCWIWTGCKTTAGYGVLSVGGNEVYAHRYSLALSMPMFWPMYADLEGDHHYACPKNCVCPQHVRPATRKQQTENLPGARRDSSSGVRGVYPKHGRWIDRKSVV